MSFQINDRLYWPEGKRKAFTLSYDDGIEQDRRLVRMMNERKVRGTFNLNSRLFGRKGRVAAGKKEVDHIKIPAEEIIRLYENYEVAGHGVNHESMYGMDTARCAEEILTCRKELEQITGRPLTGFAYAFGAVDENILNAVRLSGISYARTITSTYKFDIPLDFLQWNPTCHHDDERVMELADAFLSDDFYFSMYSPAKLFAGFQPLRRVHTDGVILRRNAVSALHGQCACKHQHERREQEREPCHPSHLTALPPARARRRRARSAALSP